MTHHSIETWQVDLLMDKVETILETGKCYWMRQRKEGIWRPCYVGEDSDENQWIHPIGCTAHFVKRMDLDYFDFVELSPPESIEESQEVQNENAD